MKKNPRKKKSQVGGGLAKKPVGSGLGRSGNISRGRNLEEEEEGAERTKC